MGGRRFQGFREFEDFLTAAGGTGNNPGQTGFSAAGQRGIFLRGSPALVAAGTSSLSRCWRGDRVKKKRAMPSRTRPAERGDSWG